MQRAIFRPGRAIPIGVILLVGWVVYMSMNAFQPAPASTPAAEEGLPFAAANTASGRQALAFNATSSALSRAVAMSQPVASLLDRLPFEPLQPGLPSPLSLSPTAAMESPASHQLKAAAKLAATPSASMQHTTPLSAQLRRLTALSPLPAPAASTDPAAQAPSAAANLISALSAPRAAPLRTPSAPPPALPPALARPIPTLPKLAAPAPVPARQPAVDAPTLDQAVAAAAGTVAAATAAVGLAQTPKPHRAIPPAQAPSQAPRPAISLRAPLPAQAFRAAAPAKAPEPVKMKLASPASTAPAPSPAGLAQTPEPHRAISPAQALSHAPRPAISLRAPLHAPAFRAAAPALAPGPAKRKLASPASAAPSPSPAELAQIKKQEAAENMKAAFTMVNKIQAAGYATVPPVALSTTPAPPVPEQPPVPVNVTSTETKSAVSMQLRISGAGVTPFDPQKQRQLINAFMDATAGNLSASQFTVLLVSSAFSSRHRSLLQAPIVAMDSSKGTPLNDVVDVTMEVSAGTPGYAAAVRDQLAALINGKSYLDMALQRAGLNTWSIKLLTISIVQPSQSGGMLPCQKTFGRWCLDKSGLTMPVVILIIALGGALLVFSIVLIIVLREVKKNSGRTAGLEYPKNDSTTMKTHVLKYVIGDHAHPSPSKE